MPTLVHVLLASLLLPAAQTPPDKRPKLPRAEAQQLRVAYADALAKHDAKSRATLLALGRKLEGKYAHDDLRDALRAGPWLDDKSLAPRKQGKKPEALATFGATTVGYTFECDAGVFRYAVDCPSRYDPSEPAPVLLDPGHGTGTGKPDEEKAGFLEFYRGQSRRAKLERWLIVRTEILEQVGANGQRGALPEEAVAQAFDALWRDLASRYAIDLDRLYATGLSQTGFWAWYLGRARPDRYAGIAPMSAVTWQVDRYAGNFSNLPVFVLHGNTDAVCAVKQPRATCGELMKLGYPVQYVEVAGAGHDVAVWGRLHEGLTWLAPRTRAKYAKSRAMALQTLANPWCGAVRVDELATTGDGRAATGPTASVSVQFDGQRVSLTSKGVRRATLCLSAELVDLAQPVEVVWNDKRVRQAVPARSFTTLLELALDRADWTETFDCALELREP
jgi:predicted esterase